MALLWIDFEITFSLCDEKLAPSYSGYFLSSAFGSGVIAIWWCHLDPLCDRRWRACAPPCALAHAKDHGNLFRFITALSPDQREVVLTMAHAFLTFLDQCELLVSAHIPSMTW
jgi:hypothetical protein